MKESPDPLRAALRRLYSHQGFKGTAWGDRGDLQYINNSLLERSIAMLSTELCGDLIDIGCGAQPYNGYFQHVRSKTNCDFDGNRGPVDFACPADQVPVADESYDSVLCTEVLEHVPEPIRVWKEFNRILRPGGRVLLSTPMYWPPHELPYDFYRYPEHGLRWQAENAGFEVKAMVPRGGVYAFMGQINLFGLQMFMRFRWQYVLWNKIALAMDSRRCSPRLVLGWTILAEKKA